MRQCVQVLIWLSKLCAKYSGIVEGTGERVLYVKRDRQGKQLGHALTDPSFIDAYAHSQSHFTPIPIALTLLYYDNSAHSSPYLFVPLFALFIPLR